MTTVNVTTANNTVSVTAEGKTAVVKTPVTTTVTATTAGPQGPKGDPGSGFLLTDTAKVDGSLIYYNSAAGSYKADAAWTISTIVVGGSF
jgi:hypothetical protein